MKSKKLLLINPAKKEANSVRVYSKFPPLSLGYIAALTPDKWEIEIVDENIKREDYEKISCDLVGITAMTSTAPRAYEIASIFRNRKIPVVMGGIHSSMLPDEALKYVDSVIIGEAESAWKNVISDYEKKTLKSRYTPAKTDLSKIPFPREDLYPKGYTMSAVQTARGCPMNCEFCSVTAFNGSIYRQRPVNSVLDELEQTKNKAISFVDDNLIGYGEKSEQRSIDLFKGMIDRGLNKLWSTQASINVANNDKILKYASESGCMFFFIGIDSVNESSLKQFGKWVNISQGLKNYKKIISKLHDYNIGVLGAFVVGADYDDKSIFNKTKDFIIDCEVDINQITIMTPLPGTRLFKRLEEEKRIMYTNYPKDWELYDATRCVIQPKNMSAEEVETNLKDTYKELLGYNKIFHRSLKSFINTGNLALKPTSEIGSVTLKQVYNL